MIPMLAWYSLFQLRNAQRFLVALGQIRAKHIRLVFGLPCTFIVRIDLRISAPLGSRRQPNLTRRSKLWRHPWALLVCRNEKGYKSRLVD